LRGRTRSRVWSMTGPAGTGREEFESLMRIELHQQS
jgi:hypothetical protein